MHFRRQVLTAAAFLVLAGCTTAERPFTLGLIPSEHTTDIQPHADALGAFLSTEMGREVTVVVPSAYESLIEGLRFGHIDAAYMDSGPAVIAVRNANADLVLAETNGGSATYTAEVFVLSGSSITQLSEVVGKRIAFTSLTGASGFLYPIGSLINEGHITPDGEDLAALQNMLSDSFAEHVFSGGYQQSLSLLLDGSVDVAPGADTAPERFLSPEEQARITSIARLGLVPSHPVLVGKNVDSATREAFVAAMLKLNDPVNVHLLTDLYGVDGITETTAEEHLKDFTPVFDALTGVHRSMLEKK